jgi:HK97 family phage portal protein
VGMIVPQAPYQIQNGTAPPPNQNGLATVFQSVYGWMANAWNRFGMIFAGGASWMTSTWDVFGRNYLPNTQVDYAAAVGDGRGSPIIMACVLWLMRNFTEAPITVGKYQRVAGSPSPQVVPVFGHDMSVLVRHPNDYYTGVLLWQATIADYTLSGNAYWIKVRDPLLNVVQLWWVPSVYITPQWTTPNSFIDYYLYSPEGVGAYALDPADVVHFQFGIDPDNTRKGFSPIAALVREVYTDDEAANFTASLMRNLGVPGVVIVPESDDVEVEQDEADRMKDDFREKFTGDRRGEPLILSSRLGIKTVSFTPEQMDLKSIRMIPEERVTAMLGLNAMVVGLGAGLSRSTFSNYAEALRAAYNSNVIPTYRHMQEDLRNQLLPDFEADWETNWEVYFDLTKVRALSEGNDAASDRTLKELIGGALTLNQALVQLGQPPVPTGNVYYVPANVVVTKVSDLGAAPAAPTPPPTQASAPTAGGQEPPPVNTLPALVGSANGTTTNGTNGAAHP